MSKLKNYMINLDVEGLEESPAAFRKFLEEYKPEFGRLLEYTQMEGHSNLFDISVPSDTNFFMLGILWAKWRMINSVDNSDDEYDIDEELYQDDDEY